MYPNIYSKRKYYGNQFNSCVMMPTQTVSNMLPMGVTQKLHPLAPPFEPKRNTIECQNQIVNDATNQLVVIDDGLDNNENNENMTTATTTQTTTAITTTANINPLDAQITDAMIDQSVQTGTIIVPPSSTLIQPQPVIPYPGEEMVAGYHPLQHVWTMWYLETDRSKTWEEMQNEISSIDNVEDFWRLYNHIKPASELKTGCDYSLFKHGIRPMWEDESNRNGGRWIMNLPRSVTKVDLDSLWLDVLLCLIGETFEQSEQLCGAVVNVRSKNNKISVWTKDGDNAKAVLAIGYKLRDVLRLVSHQLHYQLHKDTMAKTGSVVKSLYTI